MEEPHATSQVPHSDLLDEISACGNDCSCEGNKQSNSLSMPICFLVREQAKSQVAIQDLQSRLSHVETVQVGVIDTLMHFRNYLNDANSDFSTTPSFINITNSPSTFSASKTPFYSTYEPSRSVQKSDAYATKATENEFQKTSSLVTIQDQPQKLFDSTKSKESALESDKQDSGLDSDCREHNEFQPSIRTTPHWINQEANDQLLQLLDEISFRSEFLQNQLAVTENSVPLVTQNGMLPNQPNLKVETCSPNRTSNGRIETNRNFSQELANEKVFELSTINESREIGVQATIPSTKINNSGLAGFLEGKPICDRNSSNRVGKNIDSSMVSSILKETNVVDLQRQALVYLVDNAVLNAKLREMEQVLACKNLECEKIENNLKEEARLLMMENRELRMCLDEQKFETNIFKSRVAMLERVLQSMNVENQELNWQLGESFNLQQMAKKGYNLSSASTPNSVASSTRSIRKSSSLSTQSCRNPAMNYARSKLLSNATTFFDATEGESDDGASNQIQNPRTQTRNGPLLSSTPFPKSKGTVIDSTLSPGLPLSFYVAKKCLKSGHSFDSEGDTFKSARSERFTDCDIPEACVRKRPSPQSASHKPLTLATGNVSKFPFNTILEKLKANSEVRLSRHIPNAKDGEASVSASDHEVEPNTPGTQEQLSKHSKSTQGSIKSSVQAKKSGNIHQRIQNILDRIVAESEEAA